MEDQKVHQCIYCHQEAKFQFKNGKWCCSKNMNGCPEIKRQRSEKSKEVWKKVNEKGYGHLQDIPKEEQRKEQISGTPGICFYCGGEATFQLNNGKWCCKEFSSQCPAIIEKNRKGVLKAYENGLEQRKVFTEESRRKQVFYSYRKSDNSKGYKHGWYKNYWCDSSWELAYIIYNLEHNIKFKRNEERFLYNFEGKEKRFYPDFILENGTYVEIKGYHSPVTDAKIDQFPKDKKLIMLYQKDFKEHFDYVKTKYGIDYWKLLKENPE